MYSQIVSDPEQEPAKVGLEREFEIIRNQVVQNTYDRLTYA